jgi:DNA-binding transcriptional MerR regulator
MTLIKQLQACKFSLQEIRQIFNSPGGEKAAAVADVMEQVTTDLDRLKKLIQENLASASAANQPALRLAAAAALQKATGLCCLLVTVMQDTPIL